MAATKTAKPLLAEIVFRREHRCFKRGRKLVFRPGVNLIVGDQGSGKSTLIELVRDLAARSEHTREKTEKIVGRSGRKCRILSFDFERDNPRTKSYLEESFSGMVVQMNSRFVSHGETVNQLMKMMRATLDEQGGKEKFLLLLDEPDMALSPRSAHKLAAFFDELAAHGHQLIAAVHNPILISSQPEVLSLEHKRWMTSDKFLAAHAEAGAADTDA